MVLKRKKKTLTKPKLVKKLDGIFSLFVRMRDADKKGFIKCVTCSKKVFWKKAHAAHRHPRGNYIYRREEWNVNASCVYCNTYDENHYRKYTLVMINKYGLERVKEKEEGKRTVADRKTYQLREMIEDYKAKVKELEKKLII